MATSHPLATTEWQPASTLLPAKGYSTNASGHPTPFFAEVSNRHLGINDLNILFKKVKGISHKWTQFAQSLNIKQDTIDVIQHNNPKNCEGCLNEVLKQWLRRESYDYMRYGIPCWRLVCEAVREGGGDPALAEKIADEHPQPLPEIGSRRIYVPSEQNYKLANELFELKQEFSDVFYATKKSFSQDFLSDIVDYLKSHIVELLGFERTRRPKAVIEEFQSITTISDLFDVLQYNYLSWFNYKLIIKLVNEFLSSDDPVKDTWSQYEKKLEHYFMNSGALLKDAQDIPFGEFNSPPPGTKIIVVKVDREDYTLNHLFFLRRALPEKINIPEYDLYFSFVFTNSLYLEYWIPDFLHSFIFPLSEEQEKGLASLGIVTISDGGGEYSYNLNKDLKSMAVASNLDFAEFSNRELGINDLDVVYNKVKSLSIKWILFAKSLHLESYQIKNLDIIEGHNLDYCMKKVLEYWLTKKEYKYKQYGTPCWRLVYMAVEEVGNSALAEEIAREYPLSTVVTSSKADERNFLLLKNLIAKALNVPEFHIYFTFVHDSSLFWVPDFIYSLIFPLTDSKKLTKIGVIELLQVPDMQSQSYIDFEKEHNGQSMESSEKPPEVNVCEQMEPEMEK
uniref:Death domain-containing protein n=1 Tax=Amphimedon queenslandica TaxID=400682 RepID=A0A1X7TAR2_AMPQE